MKVTVIDDRTESIALGLGITPEREKELDGILQAEFEIQWNEAEKGKDGDERGGITGTMERFTKYARHPNESAYLIFHLGAHVGKIKALGDVGPMGILLAALGKGGRRG